MHAYQANVHSILDEDECFALSQAYEGTAGSLSCTLLPFRPDANDEGDAAAAAKFEDDADDAEHEPTVAAWAAGIERFVARPPPPPAAANRAFGGAAVFRRVPKRALPTDGDGAPSPPSARAAVGASVYTHGLELRFELPRGRIAYMAGGIDVFARARRKRGAAGRRRAAARAPEAARAPAAKKIKSSGTAGELLARCMPFAQRPLVKLSADYQPKVRARAELPCRGGAQPSCARLACARAPIDASRRAAGSLSSAALLCRAVLCPTAELSARTAAHRTADTRLYVTGRAASTHVTLEHAHTRTHAHCITQSRGVRGLSFPSISQHRDVELGARQVPGRRLVIVLLLLT
jgi:hypothetical protein